MKIILVLALAIIAVSSASVPRISDPDGKCDGGVCVQEMCTECIAEISRKSSIILSFYL